MTAFLANLYLRAITVRDREEGQTMAEYGVIMALIAVLLHWRRHAARWTLDTALDKVISYGISSRRVMVAIS